MSWTRVGNHWFTSLEKMELTILGNMSRDHITWPRHETMSRDHITWPHHIPQRTHTIIDCQVVEVWREREREREYTNPDMTPTPVEMLLARKCRGCGCLKATWRQILHSFQRIKVGFLLLLLLDAIVFDDFLIFIRCLIASPDRIIWSRQIPQYHHYKWSWGFHGL